MKARVMALVCWLPFAAWPAAAQEKVAPEPVPSADSLLAPGRFEPLLDGLRFGMPSEDLLAALRSSFEQRLRPRLMAAPDARQRDLLKQEIDRALEAVSRSKFSFEGQETGYSASVVGEEFRSRTGESVLVYQEGRDQTYFFLAHDLLWKVVVCRESKQPFSSLLASLARVFGKPVTVTYADPTSETDPRSAGWEDERFVVLGDDRTAVYGSHVVKWEYKPMLDRIAEWRKGGEAARPPGTISTEDLMKKVTGGDDDKSVDGIVDQLTGRKTEPPAPPQPTKKLKKQKKGKVK